MTLRPDDSLHKALISTTSRLVGEYENAGVLLTHAWPNFYNANNARWTEGPASRNAYIFAFRTEPTVKEPGVVIPDYSPMGDIVASYLSLLFGKRFDHHGLVEGSGFFHVPDLTQFGSLCNASLPQNSHAVRADYPIPLNLSEVTRIEPLFLSSLLDPKFIRVFQGSAKFYLQGLQNFEREPEVAYLHFITAGEILSSFYEFDTNTLLDDQTRMLLESIQERHPDGHTVANQIKGRLLAIKRRFVQSIMELVAASFFDHSESNEQFGRLKAETFETTIGAAYDLRSKYVHTGEPFGRWVSLQNYNAEVQVGAPVVADKEFGKILAKAPTLIGLERVIRYCLLRFAEANGGYVGSQASNRNV